MTGLDINIARFQALSAFTGTSFTTKEAEDVVDHPQRRRIIIIFYALAKNKVFMRRFRKTIEVLLEHRTGIKRKRIDEILR